MFRPILIAATLITAPAFADDHRGRGHDRHDNRGGWDRGRDHDRGRDRNWDRSRDNHRWDNRHDRNRGISNLGLGIVLGSAIYAGSRGYGYDDYRYSEPRYSNSWGLYPGQCRWDREFAYWRGRPAEVEVRRCADGYGSVYVSGSQRLWRYR